MQEETNEKTIALYIKTGKLTAQQLQKAMKVSQTLCFVEGFTL